jgi:rSAM/selenodomain-associated transferase 1
MRGTLPPAVAVMAKVPGLETVKSRLHGAITPERAALLSRCFLLDGLDALATVAGIASLVAYSPAWGHARMRALVPARCRLVPQETGDLGERMRGLLEALLAEGHRGAIAIGTDSPTLPMAHVQEAADVLRAGAAEVVLGPAEDGGYYLIGIAAPAPALFADIAWSTERVLGQTRDRAAARGLRVHLLRPWYDVDTADDLRRLRAELASRADGPRRTRRCLQAFFREG